MKDLMLRYARYNAWANKLMIDTMLKLDEAALDKEITSSFPSIRQTVYHSWGAENIWLQRLELVENPIWIPRTFTGTFPEACGDWHGASERLIQFTEKQFDDRAFAHIVLYYDMQKNHYKTPVGEVLQHVFNHATYHRGQLVTMLRQVGVTEIPQTDFIAYCRKNKA